MTYQDYKKTPNQEWINRPGNHERLENLLWARDHCHGLFRVVMVVPKDAESDPREIAECFPTNRVMKIIDLDELTGEFSAVLDHLEGPSPG